VDLILGRMARLRGPSRRRPAADRLRGPDSTQVYARAVRVGRKRQGDRQPRRNATTKAMGEDGTINSY